MDPTPSQEPIETCPKCGCTDLFVRKDFPQKVGLAVVIVASAAFLVLAARRSSFFLGAWVLAAAAAIDGVLYLLVPRITVCYRCRSEFRGRPINPRHGPYELSVGEKYRHP